MADASIGQIYTLDETLANDGLPHREGRVRRGHGFRSVRLSGFPHDDDFFLPFVLQKSAWMAATGLLTIDLTDGGYDIWQPGRSSFHGLIYEDALWNLRYGVYLGNVT